MKDNYVDLIWLQSCEQLGYEAILCKVRYDFAILIPSSFRANEHCNSACNGVVCFRSPFFQVYIFPGTFSVVVLMPDTLPWNKNQILYKRGEMARNECIFENLSAGIKILVYVSTVSSNLSRQINRKRNICFNFRSV